MLDKTIDTLLTDPKALIGGAVLALVVLIVIGRRARNAKAGKIADKLVGPVMFAGMIWSADAVWVLTGPEYLDLPTPLRIGMFSVLEFALLVAMLRAKDSMDRIGRTGAHGASAWLIASAIALFGFILGLYEGGLVVAAFRPLVPLMLTKLWWDGILGDSERKAGSFKWTPRNLLILLGAIDADDRDEDGQPGPVDPADDHALLQARQRSGGQEGRARHSTGRADARRRRRDHPRGHAARQAHIVDEG